jgi:cation transport ATPase
MRRIATQLRSPAIISSLLVLPLVGLEVINRRGFDEGFPFPLFGILWLLPVTFMVALMPIVRTSWRDGTLRTVPVSLLFRVAFLILVAWLWVAILLDQMPCFLGVPNCD